MRKHNRNPEYQKKVLVPNIHPGPDFSLTCSFRQVLDNVQLINVYKIAEHLWIQRYRQKSSNIPPKWVFPPFVTTRLFLINRAQSLLYPDGALTYFIKSKKLISHLRDIQRWTGGQTNRQTNQRQTSKSDYLGTLQINQVPKCSPNVSLP